MRGYGEGCEVTSKLTTRNHNPLDVLPLVGAMLGRSELIELTFWARI